MHHFFRGMSTKDYDSSDLILLGIPYDKGATCGLGTSKAPQVLRELSAYLPPFTSNGESIADFKIYDEGDFLDFDLAKDVIKKALNNHKFPLTIGGDHSISIYTQKAFYDYAIANNKIPVIIHIDAHPDICDVYDNRKDSHASPIRRAIEYGYKTENIVLVGIRGYEEQEVKYLDEHSEITVFKASELNKKNCDSYSCLFSYLFNRFKSDQYMIYLSYDIDANDPSFAPGTGTPEAFGLNSQELISSILDMFRSLPIKAMDIVEISPPLDINNITTWLALKSLYEIFKILKDKR